MIRASGGKIAITIRKDVRAVPMGSMRDVVRQRFGAWYWYVPAPKGHPRTPKLQTLHGRAHTMEAAVEAGLARLTEVYGLRP